MVLLTSGVAVAAEQFAFAVAAPEDAAASATTTPERATAVTASRSLKRMILGPPQKPMATSEIPSVLASAASSAVICSASVCRCWPDCR